MVFGPNNSPLAFLTHTLTTTCSMYYLLHLVHRTHRTRLMHPS